MNVTVIVPSLDPDEKLMQVVEGLLAEGFRDIVLVNDGSDAEHTAPFEAADRYPEVTVLTHEVNRGKGRALKTAFAWCLENRPDIDGVVTADGDNQHASADIRRCAEIMTAQPDKVWLGVRDFSLAHVPARSRFGNTVTRGIMRLACGVAVTDTQTGLRAIPARCLPLMLEVEGERYEYETEMLIVLHEHHFDIGEVVIDTVYIDENQTSHFDTVKDSWKIYRIIFRHMFRKLGSFLKFSASSIVSFLVDYGLFTLLNAFLLQPLGSGVRELAATYGARVVSCVVNYQLNRRLVFRAGGKGGAAWRYALLAVVQAGLSAVLVWLIRGVTNASALMETAIKLPVDICLFLASYQIQKRWVFRTGKEKN